MREEEEPNWFARWEEQLPSPEELMPLSQTLITPDLALAFDIPNPNPNPNNPQTPPAHQLLQQQQQTPPPPTQQQQQQQQQQTQSEFDSGDLGGGGGGPDEPARTLKRPRLVWTPQLHKRFVDAVAHLGIKNAVPKTIMQLMSVDGLTRENVASHLQKYRLYLKRMQGLNSSSSPGGGGGGGISAADDQLFSSGPVPHPFLSRGAAGPGGEPFLPFVPVAALQQHHQHMAALQHQQQQQQQYYHQRHMGHFPGGGGGGGGGGFDHGFLSRTMPQPVMHRMVGPTGVSVVQPPPASYVDELEAGAGAGGGGGGRRVLTLFPTGED